ncbi:hypothetical protein RFI_03684 [Reticulomyxa filosa]|uniref:Uncharacterized protein n=1 Tax=Reticulomyxa filosa TaxID=46433 RepID=X6P722_RETFI|nr:hypothetical protein RFI_03684 [Reticulomyxa filosa]|eukprot:ETO33427.1 hypothetical protein RFI_03684 [Reticulomyxa filosa]
MLQRTNKKKMTTLEEQQQLRLLPNDEEILKMSPKVWRQMLTDVGEHIKENEPIVSSSFMLEKCDEDAKENFDWESVCKDSKDENSLKKQLYTIQEQIKLLSQRLQLQESKSIVSQRYQGYNGDINPKLVVNNTCAAILSERQQVVQSSSNDNIHDLRDGADDIVMKLAMDSSNMFRHIFNGSRCDFHRWKRQFLAFNERTNDLLYFRTTVDEGQADILLRWRKAKCALKLELDYAECDIKRNRNSSGKHTYHARVGNTSKTNGLLKTKMGPNNINETISDM